MDRISLLLLSIILLVFVCPASAQDESWPDPPVFRPYLGQPGKVVKYNTFNYLDIKDEGGINSRQAMGIFWEINYTYDSVFRQKNKFRNFVVEQVRENNGNLFFEDTTTVHFVVPAEDGNIWGRLILSGDKGYRLRLIRETAFNNSLERDEIPVVRFDKYVDSIDLPPKIKYLSKSLITRATYSKFNHLTVTWNMKDTLFKKKIMGPSWDLRLEVRNDVGKVDRSVSSVEVLESYYRYCVKSGGTIIKSRPRELIFTLPYPDATLWCRITASLDGVYMVRVTLESDADQTPPEILRQMPVNLTDSTGLE